jgi:hypothetical protein
MSTSKLLASLASASRRGLLMAAVAALAALQRTTQHPHSRLETHTEPSCTGTNILKLRALPSFDKGYCTQVSRALSHCLSAETLSARHTGKNQGVAAHLSGPMAVPKPNQLLPPDIELRKSSRSDRTEPCSSSSSSRVHRIIISSGCGVSALDVHP